MKGSKKSTLFLVSVFMTTLMLMNYSENWNMMIPFFHMYMWEMNMMEFGMMTDKFCLLFILMVLTVTTLVLTYSEVYMEHYNNKKFFSLLMFFFSSMILLINSSSFMSTMTGWDMLGLSSVCLVMFYPNNMALFNTMITMFFNRMGDVMMIFSMAMMMLEYKSFIHLSELSTNMIIILILCGFTKSAQYPFSTWLPAAMSAPTPISAMVHSSTLVTAGILLMMKLSEVINMKMMYLISMISMSTYLMGGMMANYEKDSKKMVAFSTMSQISMIIFFLTFNLMMSMTHMTFHALFKTLLFCCMGLIFSLNMGTQLMNLMNTSGSNKMTKVAMFMSIFMMTGLTFSTSFYTKDTALEMLSSDFTSEKMMILMIGSMMTMMYCCKLMKSTKSKTSLSFQSSVNKNFMSILMTMFIVATFTAGMVFTSLYFLEESGKLNKIQTMTITITILMFSVNKVKKSSKILEEFTTLIYYSKEMMNSISSKTLKYTKNNMINDHYSFKMKFVGIKEKNMKTMKKMNLWTLSTTICMMISKSYM